MTVASALSPQWLILAMPPPCIARMPIPAAAQTKALLASTFVLYHCMKVDACAPPRTQVILLVGLSTDYLKSLQAQSTARNALHTALVDAATDSGLRSDGIGEMLSQISLVEDKLKEQVSNLLIAPLQALVDDPRGLGGCPKLHGAFNSLSHEYYEALAEFLSLEGEGSTSALSAKAHAKTTAMATAKMGSAAISQMSSRLGAGFKLGVGALSRSLNQHMGELTGRDGARADGAALAATAEAAGGGVSSGTSAPLASAPGSPPQTEGEEAKEPSLADSGREAIASLQTSKGALLDAQQRVLRQQARA